MYVSSGKKRTLQFFTVISILLAIALGVTIFLNFNPGADGSYFKHAFADNSTIAKYCSNGICKTSPSSNGSSNLHFETNVNLFLGIQLSKACLTDLKYNKNSTCPGYDKLIKWDNSNQKISGVFGYKDGIYQRLPSKYMNSYNYYKYFNNKTLIMVDPDFDLIQRSNMKLITFIPTQITYSGGTDQTISNSNIRQEYRNILADQSCNNVSISDISLLNESLNYLSSGCTIKITSYNVTMSSHAFDIKHCQSCIEKNYTHVTAKTYMQDCLRHKCTPVKDPFSNW